MAWFSRRLTEKDIASIHLGKKKSYKLPRGSGAILFAGALLAFYREELTPEERESSVTNYLDVLALFKTEKQHYFVYYEVEFTGEQYKLGRQRFVALLKSMAEVENFLNKMSYSNSSSFRSIILSEAKIYDAAWP
ncbi:hypothetical protein DGI_3154 [Megalodesulfovibrio gigas DSM 1382 = ATCC 19364]|uniref:Uncharacterized protein n=2 Tax=Megalodesulfovibrio gigas TaxID=879 RepID=T2GFX9_MEGG1|nr:hypothetical protein DGI_3154 [Megalodesulfovibrio gigas DSM 1382 = ATCC 19364]